MSLRYDWQFQYSRDALRKAVDQKILHHIKRIEWWEKEDDKAEAAIKEAGIDIREYAVTGGNRAELVIDPVLLSRFQETQSKIRAHKGNLKEYRRYYRALENQSSTVGFQLDIEDIQFFGL